MNHFIAEVRNLKDPWESGRVQIRIYGAHDDEENIKDDDLPWAMVAMPVTSASTNKIGTSPTGLLIGSRVIGYFMDEAHQYPIITGSFHRAGKQKDENDNTKGFDDIDEEYSDVPIGAVGSKRQTKKTNTRDKRTTKKQPKYDAKNPPKYNKNEYESDNDGEDALEASKKNNSSKTKDLKTVGSTDKNQAGNSILNLILKNDQGNEAGALPQAPQLFQQILQISNMSSMSGMSGLAGGALGGMFSQVASLSGLGGVENLVGQLSGMLGGMMSGGGGSGGGSNIGSMGGTGQITTSTGGVASTIGSVPPLYQALSVSNYTDAEFLVDLFQIAFGRKPKTDEFKYWGGVLASGTKRKDILPAFFNSEEYNKEFPDDTSFVKSLYQNVLNRPADEGGLKYWTDSLKKQKTIPDVTKLTLAQAISDSVDLNSFLQVAYKIILERTPDDAGLNYWLNAKMSKSNIILAFFTVPEYLSKYSDPTVWSTKLYEKLLEREPDPAGLKYCLDQIKTNPTSTLIKQTLVQNGLNSDEFKNLSIQPYATTTNPNGGVARAQVVEGFLNSKEFSNDFYRYELNAYDTALIAADLLNQLKGFTTPSTQIGGMTVQQREVLYNALLTLFNNTYVPVAQKLNLPQITSNTIHEVDFIARLYNLILNRDYDYEGLNYWLGILRKGVAREEIIISFFISKEYVDKYQGDYYAFVTSLYEKILSRTPDELGLAYWADLLITKTLTIPEVVHHFIYNDEFKNDALRNTREVNLNSTVLADIISPAVSNVDFLIRLYEISFKREPDIKSFKYWLNYLEKGMSRIDIISYFFCSEEYNNEYSIILDFVVSLYVNILNRKPVSAASDTDFITRTYDLLFVRDPTSDELSYWLDKLNNGLSRNDFLTNFISDENFKSLNPEKYVDTLVKSFSSLNNSDFVIAVYNNLYHRKPTDPELTQDVAKLNNGLIRTRYVESILTEIENTEKFNPNKYNIDIPSVLFRLTVSFEEQDYWTDLLEEETLTRLQVVQAFLRSDEFINLIKASGNIVIDDSRFTKLITNPPLVMQLLGNQEVDVTNLNLSQLVSSKANNTDFVIRMYQIALDREYEDAGLQYWLDRMATNGENKYNIAYIFFTCPEYYSHYPDDTSFIISLYDKMLNRKPDEAGLQWWLDQLKNKTETRETAVLKFLESKEFLNKALSPTTTLKSTPTGSFTIDVTINDYPETITVYIVDGKPTVTDSQLIPDGYFQIFTYTDYDPYPGYIRWEGPNGEILYSTRPANEPYTSTPSENAINYAIVNLMNDLLIYVNNNTLTLEILLQILGITVDTVQKKADQNVLGNNINAPNSQRNGGASNAMQNILGLLGQLIGMAQSMHLTDSVLDQGKMNNLIQKRSRDMAMLKMKKKLAKQAIGQKNEMQGMNPNQLLGFGNMAKNFGGKGGANGSSKNQPNYGNQNSSTSSVGSGSGAPVNNVITYTTKWINGNNINITVINGRNVIQVKDLPNGYLPVDVESDPNFIKWMLLNHSAVVSQQVPFFTLKTKEAISKASQYLPNDVIMHLSPVTGEVLTTNIGGAYHVGFYPIIS